MKKQKTALVILLCLLARSVLLIACNSEPQYFITFNKQNYNVNGNTIHVEYGDMFTVPSAYLTDADGEELDVDIDWSFKNAQGTECKNYTKMYYMENGESYTLTYTALTDETQIANLVYTVECSDTLTPQVSLIGLRTLYGVGDKCTFAIQNISDASGVNNAKTSVKAYDSNGEVAINNYSFDLATAGSYRLEIYTEDNCGNGKNDVYNITVVDEYVEPQAQNTLWGFESANATACVSPASSSDNFTWSITNEKVDSSSNSLKLELKAGAQVNFYLTNGSGLPVEEIGDVIFHVYATNLVDNFRVYSRVDEREVKFDYKILKNKWIDLTFDAHEMFDDPYYEVTELRVTFWAEEDSTLYIDGVYTTTYIPPWKDENLQGSMWTKQGALKSGLLADFDEAEYEQIIGDVSGTDYSTPGGQYEILPAGSSEIPQGSSGGVLKFTTTTVPRVANPSDMYSRDGFHIDFSYGIDIVQLPYFTFNVDLQGKKYMRLTVMLQTDMGETSYLWLPVDYVPEGGYQKIILSPSEMLGRVEKSATTVTGMYLRFLRSEADYNADPGDWTLYMDSIEYYYADPLETMYANNDYAFNAIDHLQLVEAVGNSVLSGIVQDENAKDGYVLKAVTSYDGTCSGVLISLNDIDVNDYEQINVRLRTAWPGNPDGNGVSIYINGEYCEYDTWTSYTEINILDLFEGDVISSVQIGRKTCAGIEIYVDEITFIPKAE